jgi:dihydrofolate reductase
MTPARAAGTYRRALAEGTSTMSIIVIQFITLDGVVSDPEDLIDEYGLLTFPTILGTGRRLFPAAGPPAFLETLSTEQPAAVLTRYRRAAQ